MVNTSFASSLTFSWTKLAFRIRYQNYTLSSLWPSSSILTIVSVFSTLFDYFNYFWLFLINLWVIGEDTQVNFGMHFVLGSIRRNPRSNSQKIPIYFSGLRWFFFCVTAFLRRSHTYWRGMRVGVITTDEHKYRLSRTYHYRVYAS